jgi:hypothetical protein
VPYSLSSLNSVLKAFAVDFRGEGFAVESRRRGRIVRSATRPRDSRRRFYFSLKSAMTGAKSTRVLANFSGRTRNISVPQRRRSLRCFPVV